MGTNNFTQIIYSISSLTCFILLFIILTIRISFCQSIKYDIRKNKFYGGESKVNRAGSGKKDFINEIPVTRKLPIYQCSSFRGAKSEKETGKFFIAKNILKKFNQSREHALEYLYNEMDTLRKYYQCSIESAITLEQILMTLDASIRCDLHYFPFNSFQQYHLLRAYDEINIAKSKYKVMEYNPEVFYYHHRLRFAQEEIKDYIRQRDIIDMGAFCGDSMVIFNEYTDKTIYSYEYSLPNIEKIKKAIVENNIPKDKVKIINKGISDEIRTIKSEGIGKSFSRIVEGKEGQTVYLTTLDFEAKDLNMKVGLIKGDIEGFEYKAIKGAMNLIREHRPVISISLYHNAESFFRIPRLLFDLENYQFEILCATFENDLTLLECSLFAYPKEIFKK